MNKGRLCFILILLLAFWIRVVYIFQSPSILLGDEIAYDQITKRFLSEGSLLNSRGELTAFRPPLYFLFLSTVFYFTHSSILWAKVLQAILSLAIVVMVYRISKELLGKEVGQISLLASAGYMPLIWAPTRLYSEIVFLTFFTACFFYFIRLWRNPTFSDGIKFGILSGLSALVRGISIGVFPLFLIALFWQHSNNPHSSSQLRIKKVIVMILIFFSATILPWLIRNYYAFGVPTYTTETGMVLYTSYFPAKRKIFSKIPLEDPVIKESLTISSELQRERFLMGETFKKLIRSPFRLIELIPLKFASFWSPFHWEIYHVAVYDWSYVFLFPFFLFGFFLLTANQKVLIPLCLPMIGVLTVSMIFYGSARMRFPIEPFFVIIASCGLHKIVQKRSMLWNLSTVSWLSLNFLVSFYFLGIKSFFKNLATLLGLWS